MKGMKKKLAAAAAMLVVSAVMLSGVSYAWYTLSTNPTVENIKANIAANENLEIALDNGYNTATDVDDASKYSTSNAQGSTAGDPYTWGNLVDLTTAMGTMNPDTGSTTTPKLILAPVKYDSGALKYPQYDVDGRVKDLGTLTADYVSDLSGKGTSAGVAGWKQSGTSTVYDALSVTYWLRSNEDCAVSLSANGVKRAGSTNDTQEGTSDVNTVLGKGSYIEIPLKKGTENKIARVDEYVKNLVVQLDVAADGTNDATTYYAKLTKSTTDSEKVDATADVDGKVRYYLSLVGVKNSAVTDTTPAATIPLKANTARKVAMYVYLDGETVTNADALLDDITGMTMNIQFLSPETEGPGAMNGATYVTP